MAKAFLVDRQGVEQRLRQRYRNSYKEWLAGGGEWPLAIPLGLPSEQQAHTHLAAVQQWQATWHRWRGEGDVLWVDRHWPQLGTQRLPEKILVHTPLQVTRWIGEEERWQRASERQTTLMERWPRLAGTLYRYFDLLADYQREDFRRLFAMLEWLEVNPDSNLYIRQLPVEGVDTKWLSPRKPHVGDLLKVIRGECDVAQDFHELTGIRREPVLMRFRVLSTDLRGMLGGLADVTIPVEEIAQLQLPIQQVYIVENLQTGLAFQELPGALVFVRLGYAVDLFEKIPWLRQLRVFYWGDIDTHGFAILNRLRHYLPEVRSLLMDEDTLLTHRNLCVEEDKPAEASVLLLLTEAEQRLYDDLRNHRWGLRVRLEQERIPWSYVWQKVRLAK